MNQIMNRKSENYKEFFTKDYLMGPNSLRLLDEVLQKYPLKPGSRVMDLGCGAGLTSLFLAKEARVNVFATDLWISATQNARTFENWGISDQVIPIHADANELPYAEEYFDAIVSIDSYHYFANKRGYFEEKILPYLKVGGTLLVAMPGIKEPLWGEARELTMEWVEGDQEAFDEFRTKEWWVDLIGHGDNFEQVMAYNMDSFDEAWQDWFDSGHEYGIKDRKYFARGIGKYLSFVSLVIRRTK